MGYITGISSFPNIYNKFDASKAVKMENKIENKYKYSLTTQAVDNGLPLVIIDDGHRAVHFTYKEIYESSKQIYGYIKPYQLIINENILVADYTTYTKETDLNSFILNNFDPISFKIKENLAKPVDTIIPFKKENEEKNNEWDISFKDNLITISNGDKIATFTPLTFIKIFDQKHGAIINYQNFLNDDSSNIEVSSGNLIIKKDNISNHAVFDLKYYSQRLNLFFSNYEGVIKDLKIKEENKFTFKKNIIKYRIDFEKNEISILTEPEGVIFPCSKLIDYYYKKYAPSWGEKWADNKLKILPAKDTAGYKEPGFSLFDENNNEVSTFSIASWIPRIFDPFQIRDDKDFKFYQCRDFDKFVAEKGKTPAIKKETVSEIKAEACKYSLAGKYSFEVDETRKKIIVGYNGYHISMTLPEFFKYANYKYFNDIDKCEYRLFCEEEGENTRLRISYMPSSGSEHEKNLYTQKYFEDNVRNINSQSFILNAYIPKFYDPLKTVSAKEVAKEGSEETAKLEELRFRYASIQHELLIKDKLLEARDELINDLSIKNNQLSQALIDRNKWIDAFQKATQEIHTKNHLELKASQDAFARYRKEITDEKIAAAPIIMNAAKEIMDLNNVIIKKDAEIKKLLKVLHEEKQLYSSMKNLQSAQVDYLARENKKFLADKQLFASRNLELLIGQEEKEYNSFTNMTKRDAKEAVYRVGANQMISLLKNSIIAMLKAAGKDNQTITIITDILNSDIGVAILSCVCGYSIEHFVDDNQVASKFAQELRVHGIALAGNSAFESLFGFITSAIAPVLNENKELTKVRVAENNKDEETVDEVENEIVDNEKMIQNMN